MYVLFYDNFILPLSTTWQFKRVNTWSQTPQLNSQLTRILRNAITNCELRRVVWHRDGRRDVWNRDRDRVGKPIFADSETGVGRNRMNSWFHNDLGVIDYKIEENWPIEEEQNNCENLQRGMGSFPLGVTYWYNDMFVAISVYLQLLPYGLGSTHDSSDTL